MYFPFARKLQLFFINDFQSILLFSCDAVSFLMYQSILEILAQQFLRPELVHPCILKIMSSVVSFPCQLSSRYVPVPTFTVCLHKKFEFMDFSPNVVKFFLFACNLSIRHQKQGSIFNR